MAGAAAPITMGIGTAVQAIGALQAGDAEQAAAEHNAQIADGQAREIIRQTAEEERAFRVMARRQLGDVRSGYAASNIQLEGSALDVLEESAANSERDALNIRKAGAMRAWEASQQAEGYRMQGDSAKTASYYGAASSVLSGAGNILKRT